MWGTFLSNYKQFSCQSSCLLLLLEVCKNHYRKENNSVGGCKQGRNTLFLNSFKRDLTIRIFITLDVYEFLNIIFNNISVSLHKCMKYWVLYLIIAWAKQIKIEDMTLTRIRLLLCVYVCVCVCVCVCLRPSTVKPSSVWNSWDCQGTNQWCCVEDVGFLCWSLHLYFGMQSLTFQLAALSCPNTEASIATT